MRILFIYIVMVGMTYVFLSKRRFDFFSLAFISAVVYFIPGFTGYVFLPGWIVSEILSETYFVMCLVLTSILTGSFVFDRIKEGNSTPKNFFLKGAGNTLLFIQLVSIVSFILMILTVGEGLFLAEKQDLLKNLNRWVILWENASALGLVTSVVKKRKYAACYFAIMLAFDIYIGNRSVAAISMISIMTYLLYNKGKQRLLFNNLRTIVIGVVLAVFFFCYKQLYIQVKLGLWKEIAEKIISVKFYLDAIMFSEPFGIQAVLNETIDNNFSVGIKHFGQIIYQFILFSNKMGAQNNSFSELFQSTLFPNVKYGMGSNIWAEMWSSGGWMLLILFTIIYVIVIYWGTILFNIFDESIKPVILISMSYWGFYIHRNNLDYQINLIKRVFLIWLFCVILSIVFSKRKTMLG